ncbi:hypothetical protein AB0G02_29595 [Actinosynnema sp. NPDC023658]|uniref:hypothetical protein n=1 Tax=Actinosynnema sp. NPDC023658 TaxID=3155465 RepID=UPI0033F572D4
MTTPTTPTREAKACWSASGYADSDPGRLVAWNNSLTDAVGTVKSSVMAGSGAGRL